jgi:hypothetical protein
MPWATYDAHSTELARMVDTLLDRPDWLKRWRLLAIYEAGGTNEPLGHVLELRDGAVVVMRITNDHDSDDPHLEDRRQSTARLLQPISGEPEQRFQMASRRAQFMVSARYLIEAIDAGQRKVVLSPGWTR